MAYRFVVALFVASLFLALVGAQETTEDETNYDEIATPGWRFASTEESRLLRYQELQDQWSQKDKHESEEERAATPPRPVRPQPRAVNLSILRAPKVAKKAYQRAFDEFKKQRPNLAKVRADLSKAVDECPEMAPAWELLGWLATQEQKPGEARRMFLKSIEADKAYQGGYIALARTAANRGRWAEAVKWSEQAVQIDPSTSRAHFYWAIASFQLGALDVAAREATNALESPEPFMPAHTHQLLGAVHHQQADHKRAADEYRIFLRAHPKHPLSASLAQQIADWEAAGLVEAAPKPKALQARLRSAPPN